MDRPGFTLNASLALPSTVGREAAPANILALYSSDGARRARIYEISAKAPVGVSASIRVGRITNPGAGTAMTVAAKDGHPNSSFTSWVQTTQQGIDPYEGGILTLGGSTIWMYFDGSPVETPGLEVGDEIEFITATAFAGLTEDDFLTPGPNMVTARWTDSLYEVDLDPYGTKGTTITSGGERSGLNDKYRYTGIRKQMLASHFCGLSSFTTAPTYSPGSIAVVPLPSQSSFLWQAPRGEGIDVPFTELHGLGFYVHAASAAEGSVELAVSWAEG